MRRLIFFVLRTRVIQIGELVERKLAIAFRGTEQVSLGASVGRKFSELAHVFVSGFCRIAVAQAAAASDHLQRGVEHAGVESVFKTLVHVAHFPELFFDPAGFDFFLKLAEHRGRRIIFLQRFESRLGSEHAALDREMNALESRRVQEAGGVSENHPAITANRRNRPPAAVRHGLRSVANHFAALKQLCYQRMFLEFLQHALRVEARIWIIESGNEPERDDIVFTAVNPRASVFFRGERPAHRVDDFARRDAAGGNFPEFFHADAVSLRVGIFREIEFVYELLGQRSARAFGENDDLGVQVVTRFEVGFLVTLFVDTFVVGADACHAVAVE